MDPGLQLQSLCTSRAPVGSTGTHKGEDQWMKATRIEQGRGLKACVEATRHCVEDPQVPEWSMLRSLRETEAAGGQP